jgi:hypothetical protein
MCPSCGYRLLRAGLRAMALLVCGAFDAVFYTLDLPVPIIGFGPEVAFAPRRAGQWLAYGLTAASET